MMTEVEVWEKCDEFDREVESMDLTEYEKQLFGDEDEEVKKSEDPSISLLQKAIEEAISKFTDEFGRFPTEDELYKVLEEIDSHLEQNLRDAVKQNFKRVYEKGMDDVGKELGVNVLWTKQDDFALSVLENQPVLQRSFAGLRKELSLKVRDVIRDSIKNEGLDRRELTRKIQDVTNLAESRAENIARTESSKVMSAARKNSYQKEQDFDKFLFKWIGPDDQRTTKLSKRIKARVGKGATWNNLLKIITEESHRVFPEWTVDPDFPVSHYQSRHTFVRVQNL